MARWSGSQLSDCSEDSFISGVYYKKEAPSNLKGPIKAARLCILSLLIPGILVIAPLYIRYHVYPDHKYPLAITDMRILDQKMSTFWCQRHIVNTNATFNAFLMPEKPSMLPRMEYVEMERHITLEDDIKEYWGFYLLKDSFVKITTCSRWPGASLIVIRGHKHLKECAYIGDNSSEELEEEESSEEGNDTHIPNFMRKLTSGMTVPDMAPDVVYLTNHPNEHNLNQIFFKKSSKTTNHHLDYAEDLYKKELKNRLENEDEQVAPVKKSKPNSELINHIPQSKELISEYLRKLGNQGKDGATLLRKLKEVVKNDMNNSMNDTAESSNRLYKIVATAMADDDASWRGPRLRHLRNRFQRSPTDNNEDHENLSRNLFKHDQQNDAAIEEADALSPDGIAQVRGKVTDNNTHDMLKDRSHSEFWSSFSSSEEMLLECEGLLLSLPLAPHHKCLPPNKQPDYEAASHLNTVNYKIPSDGYYFFVFNSENEIQDNFIRIHFGINKTVYDVSKPVSSCLNTTGECQLPLNFWSGQTTVLEMLRPGPSSDSEDEFIAISTCQPRSAVYAVCLIAAPILFVLFSFH
ncbi:Domain of unknown function DUF4792,Domain of unknown function DUF4793 [Cinara cedri]|uniref:E3 ubiquitin-protein ligase APD1-4 middle domain-containing protein n=1 Tax=Cinara cedri TaxID=506608 RepID=A0A5E4MA96_9HEMI|nr:Domain of unknown function DUF4792,Domain of unknown function DUF4793 [Cinara cedri]